jgi:hypothetical protein
MNGRITLEKTPAKRLTALAISVLWKRFAEFKKKHPGNTNDAYLEQFLDYADLESYIEVGLEKELLLARVHESSIVQDRYRKAKLHGDLSEAMKRVTDLKL